MDISAFTLSVLQENLRGFHPGVAHLTRGRVHLVIRAQSDEGGSPEVLGRGFTYRTALETALRVTLNDFNSKGDTATERTSPEDKIRAVRAHALRHISTDGWDLVVKQFSNSDIDYFTRRATSLHRAIATVERIVRFLSDIREVAQGNE